MGLRIGLLTGTFDPIHLGHLELAKAAKSECGLDEVWLMVNPKKVNSIIEFKDGVQDYRHRLKMSKLATEDTVGVKVYVGPLAERPHTMTTFLELMRNNPDDKFVFIVGMDAISRLDGWEDYESVVNSASFAVATRPGAVPETINSLKRRLGPLGEALDVHLFEFDDHGAATSTKIRDQIRSGQRPESVDDSVYEYILKHDLYI